MRDTLRIENLERVDREDFEFAVQDTAIANAQNVPENVLTDPSGKRELIVDGFDMANLGAGQLQVTRGVAVLSFREKGVIQNGAVTTQGELTRIQDLSAFADATYDIYVRFQFQQSDFNNRVFWDVTSDAEFTNSIATRREANWGLIVALASPGAEWFKIGEVTLVAGVITLITKKRDFYFEEDESATPAYDETWGGGTDRNADRATNGVKDFQTWARMVNKKLDEIQTGTNPAFPTTRRWEVPTTGSLDDMIPLSGTATSGAIRGQLKMVAGQEFEFGDPFGAGGVAINSVDGVLATLGTAAIGISDAGAPHGTAELYVEEIGSSARGLFLGGQNPLAEIENLGGAGDRSELRLTTAGDTLGLEIIADVDGDLLLINIEDGADELIFRKDSFTDVFIMNDDPGGTPQNRSVLPFESGLYTQGAPGGINVQNLFEFTSSGAATLMLRFKTSILNNEWFEIGIENASADGQIDVGLNSQLSLRHNAVRYAGFLSSALGGTDEFEFTTNNVLFTGNARLDMDGSFDPIIDDPYPANTLVMANFIKAQASIADDNAGTPTGSGATPGGPNEGMNVNATRMVGDTLEVDFVTAMADDGYMVLANCSRISGTEDIQVYCRATDRTTGGFKIRVVISSTNADIDFNINEDWSIQFIVVGRM